jgi:hypothetical protein
MVARSSPELARLRKRVPGIARWERVFGGEDVLACADLHGAVAPGGADKLPDGPSGAVLDEPGDGQAAKTIVRWASMESRLWW